MKQMIDVELVKTSVSKTNEEALPDFKEYITKKAISPAYDKEWATHKDLLAVANQLKAYVNKHSKEKIARVENLQVLEQKSPVLYFSIGPSIKAEPYSILLYGHLDKIPADPDDKDAYTPRVENNILYGKGSANNGFALFSIISAIEAIQAQESESHPLIHVIIESSSESGSPDLRYYLDYLDFMKPNMVICLDSEAPTYGNLWLTTSMRGQMYFDFDVQVTTKALHCGKFGGIIPDSFMIMKELFIRLEKNEGDKVTYPLLEKPIPPETMAALTETATILGDTYYTGKIKLEENVALLQPTTKDMYIANTYKPALFITGQDGLPTIEKAGATLRTGTTFRLNVKTQPMGNVADDFNAVKKALTDNPPFSAPITIANTTMIQGCELKPFSDKLIQCLKIASSVFGTTNLSFCHAADASPSAIIVKETYPDATIILTGAAGRDSNRYGMKENLDMKYWNAITACLAVLISQYASLK